MGLNIAPNQPSKNGRTQAGQRPIHGTNGNVDCSVFLDSSQGQTYCTGAENIDTTAFSFDLASPNDSLIDYLLKDSYMMNNPLLMHLFGLRNDFLTQLKTDFFKGSFQNACLYLPEIKCIKDHWLTADGFKFDVVFHDGRKKMMSAQELQTSIKKRIMDDFDNLYLEMTKLSEFEQDLFYKYVTNSFPKADNVTRYYSVTNLDSSLRLLQDYNKTGGGINLEKYLIFATEQKENKHNEAEDKINNQGAIDKIIFDCWSGLSYMFNNETVGQSLIKDINSVNSLKKLLAEGDLRDFYTEYLCYTGVEFNVDNIRDMQETIKKYETALEMNEMEPYIDALEKDPNIFRNYSNCGEIYKNYNEQYLLNTNLLKDGPCFVDSSKPRREEPEASPLVKALNKYLGCPYEAEKWIKQNIKRLHLENRDAGDKYIELSKEFLNFINKNKEDVPDYKRNLKRYKKAAEDATKKALGKQAACDKIDSILTAVKWSNRCLKAAIYCGLPLPASALITNGIDFINNRTDGSDSKMSDDVKNFLIGTALSYGGGKLGEAVCAQVAKRLTKDFIGNILSREAGNTADITFESSVASIIDGTDITPELMEAYYEGSLDETASLAVENLFIKHGRRIVANFARNIKIAA